MSPFLRQFRTILAGAESMPSVTAKLAACRAIWDFYCSQFKFKFSHTCKWEMFMCSCIFTVLKLHIRLLFDIRCTYIRCPIASITVLPPLAHHIGNPEKSELLFSTQPPTRSFCTGRVSHHTWQACERAKR